MSPAPMTAAEIDGLLRPVLLKDLRIICRARGVSPAGGMEALRDRLKEHMISTGDYSIKTEETAATADTTAACGVTSADLKQGTAQNNYNRPGGQNVGNFLTDRNSSRVLAPPGGRSQIVFGDEPSAAPAPKAAPKAAAENIISWGEDKSEKPSSGSSNNNYQRPGGQNVGNFLTDRNSSRVLAPPGGKSQIIFG